MSSIGRLVARVRIDLRLQDRLLVAGFAVAGLVESLALDLSAAERAATVPIDLVVAAGLLLRRRAPFAAATIFVAAAIAMAALAPGALENSTVPFIALFFYIYALGAYADLRPMVAGCVLTWLAISAALAFAVPDEDAVGGLLFVAIFVAAPAAVGRALRNRRLLAEELEEKGRRMARDREERARRAVDQERARIARELHDVVAHSISVMTVQAEGVSRVAARYPEQARTSLEAIENTGREALTEMRRLLGVLRRDDEAVELAPQPSLGQVQHLVERARGAGLPVELRIEGAPRALPAGIDLAAYRIVQEALTDALGHAGARRARVTVRYGDRNVRLEVVDDGTSAGRDAASGELIGMRERVALYGGDLEAGAGAGVEYGVRARLPLDLVRA